MVLRELTLKELQLEKLIKIYQKAEIQIKKELTRKKALNLVDFAEQAALKRVQQTLQEMTQAAEEQAPIAIESFFDSTADAMISTKTNIVNTLVNNYLGKIDEAAEIAYTSAVKYLAVGRLAADEIRSLSLERVAEAEALGKGWRDAQRKLAIDLNNKGVTAFVDKAGREWDLTAYCSMLTRTTAKQATVAAELTENDHDLWQIIPHGTTCALCSAYEGRVYSKSGTDPDYPPLASAFGKIDPYGRNDLTNTYLNIHPNCLHSLAPYTTMGKTDEEIQKDKDYSSFEKRPANVDYRTELERDQYRAKEKARAEYRNTKKQFEKYKAAGVPDMPVRLQTFEKNKRAGTDKYKEWERKYREINKKDTKELELLTESEESHKVRKVATQYSRDAYSDSVLKNKIDSLGENVDTGRELFQSVKDILKHRDGTHFEDLGFVFSDGKKTLINKSYDFYDGTTSACKPTRKMMKALKKAPDNSVIGFHNHPTSNSPSFADIQAAYERNYKYGLVFTHDGTMYKYAITANYDPFNAFFKLDELSTALYNKGVNSTAFHDAIRELEKVGVKMEVIK